jgi:SAM-dependent methyltransferase
MAKFGLDIDSHDAWEGLTPDYIGALENEYHRHRLAVIRQLIPDNLFRPGRAVFDFGCGDAVLFVPFLKAGAAISGVDVANDMVRAGQDRLARAGADPSLIKRGGVDSLASLAANSLDAVLSFNVLAYLTDDEDAEFYRQAARVLQPGGVLVVTHSNELFDLFTLNRYTVEFLAANLLTDPTLASCVPSLLTHPDQPASQPTYNVRENPLSYKWKLARFGFEEVAQEFINHHAAPPLVLGSKAYPDTVNWPEAERWKLMFTCSTYGSRSVRKG